MCDTDTMGRKKYTEKFLKKNKKCGFLISWKMYSEKEEKISDRKIVFLSELSRGKST